jgi:hypothetical protein
VVITSEGIEMKKNIPKQRPNQKLKRVSGKTNNGCRYVMTAHGLYPLPTIAKVNAMIRRNRGT